MSAQTKSPALLLLLCAATACIPFEPEPRQYFRYAPDLPVGVASEPEAPQALNVAEVLTLGGDPRDARQELAGASATLFFLECLERRLGKKVKGDILERHIRRNTKDARACRAEYVDMDQTARANYVTAWVAKQKGREL